MKTNSKGDANAVPGQTPLHSDVPATASLQPNHSTPSNSQPTTVGLDPDPETITQDKSRERYITFDHPPTNQMRRSIDQQSLRHNATEPANPSLDPVNAGLRQRPAGSISSAAGRSYISFNPNIGRNSVCSFHI